MAIKTINRLQCAAGTTQSFDPTHTWVILNYVDGDIDNVTIQSSTAGSAVNIQWQTGNVVAPTGATFTDVDATGSTNEIDATDNCTDGDGNTNIDFGAVGHFFFFGSAYRRRKVCA